MQQAEGLLVLACSHAHHGRVGVKDSRALLALAVCVLVPLSGLTGCTYNYPEPVRSPTAASAPATAAPRPYDNTEILEREAENYAELYRQLGAAPGPVLLSEVGPLDGPVRGFGKFEKVPTAGQYTVTAACVGATGAKVSFGQEHPGAPFRPVELELDCGGSTSQVIALEQGYLFAHLVLPEPGDTPWTGAVGGVRVTGGGPRTDPPRLRN
jgi:hypothetical protein